MKRKTLTLAAVLLLTAGPAFADECAVVGIKPLGQYAKASQRRCFSNVKKATKAGFEKLEKSKVFNFSMSGDKEVPPVTTTATGTCVAVLSELKDELAVMCEHSVANVSDAHIHQGAVGVDGGIVCAVSDPQSPFAVFCPLTAELLAALNNDELYVNVHSGAFSGGEIRGQIQND